MCVFLNDKNRQSDCQLAVLTPHKTLKFMAPEFKMTKAVPLSVYGFKRPRL
jgi:hypothetical protein